MRFGHENPKQQIEKKNKALQRWSQWTPANIGKPVLCFAVFVHEKRVISILKGSKSIYKVQIDHLRRQSQTLETSRKSANFNLWHYWLCGYRLFATKICRKYLRFSGFPNIRWKRRRLQWHFFYWFLSAIFIDWLMENLKTKKPEINISIHRNLRKGRIDQQNQNE